MLKSIDNKYSHICDEIITRNNRNDRKKTQSTVGHCGDREDIMRMGVGAQEALVVFVVFVS